MLPLLAVAGLGAAWIGMWMALVTQTSLVTYAAILLVRRVLHKLCRSDKLDQPPAVAPCDGGFSIRNAVISEQVLCHINAGPIQLRRAAVKELVLQWPTWTLPCRVRIHGVVLEMQQRQLPKPQGSTTPWKHKEENKLKILEQLLWSGPSPKTNTNKQRLLEQLEHLGLQLLVRTLTLELQETVLLYVQDGDPGPPCSPPPPALPGQPTPPAQPDQPAGRRDAVMVEVRSISFGPTTKAGKSAAAAATAPASEGTPVKPAKGTMPAVSPSPARAAGWGTPTRTPGSESGAATSSRTQAVGRATGTPGPHMNAADILRSLGPQDSAAAEKTAALRRLLKLAVTVIKSRQRKQPEAQGRRLGTAARLAVSGVRVLLLTKDSQIQAAGAPGVPGMSTAKSRAAGAAETNTVPAPIPAGLGTSTIWVRGRRVRVSPALRGHAARLQVHRQQQQHTAMAEDEEAAAAKLPLTELAAWDAAHCLLQHWGAEVEASWRLVKGKPADGSSVLGAKARGYVDGMEVQPALVVTASFGVRSKDDQLKVAGGLDGVPATYDNSGTASPVRPPPVAKAAGAKRTAPAPQQQGSGLQIKVSAHLNALVLSLGPESAVLALRIVNRFLTYSKFQQYWSRRPSLPVSKAPASWWQHAGDSVINTCRERFPIRHFGDSLKLRQEYMGVYAEIKQRTAPFVPNPSAGRRKAPKGTPAAAAIAAAAASAAAVRARAARAKAYAKESLDALENRLSHLEAKLTLAQVVTYRTCVALQHSQYILSHPDGIVAADWKTLLDTLNVFVDAHPTLEDDADMNVLLSNEEAAEHSKSQSMLRWKLRCPRVGLRLVANGAPGLPDSAAGATPNGPAAGEQGSVRPPSVLELVVEDVAVSIPDGHHVAAKANTIRLGMASNNITPSILIPASPAFLLETLPKYDPPVNDLAEGRVRRRASNSGMATEEREEVPHRELPPVFLSSHDSMRGTLYPDAAISEYLPRLKVSVAPVEVHLATQTGIEFVSFLKAFAVALNRSKPAAARRTGSKAEEGSSRKPTLRAMVIDSYVRNSVKVPSALAQLLPKFQVVCPRIAVQIPIEKKLLAKAYQDAASGYTFQLNLIKLRTCVAYTTTPYGELAQSMSTNFDLEAAINVVTTQSKRTHLVARLWLHPADAGAMDIATTGSRPIRRQASASALSKPAPAPTPLQPVASPLLSPLERRQLPSFRVQRGRSTSLDGGHDPLTQLSADVAASASPITPATRGNLDPRRSDPSRQATPAPASAAREPGSSSAKPATSFSSRYKCLHPSLPFVPIIRIKSLSLVSISQVPLEPTVPGHHISHHTVSMFGAMVWWTAFSVDALLAMVEQAMRHPVATSNLKAAFAGRTGDAGQQPPAGAASAPPPPRKAARHQQAKHGSISTSKTSVLVDVPLLTVMMYARMDDDVNWSAHDLGQKLVPARWLAAKGKAAGPNGTPEADSPAAALEGLRLLTPLISLNLVDLRVGGRLDGRNTELQVNVAALHSENHQLRMQQIKVWQANSSDASRPRPTAGGVTSPFVYSLASSDARTFAAERLARARARVVLGVDIRLAQVYRRVLEMQLVLRASDYAFFLLTALDKPDMQLEGVQDQPFEYYRRLCRGARGELGAGAGAGLDSSASVTGPADRASSTVLPEGPQRSSGSARGGNGSGGGDSGVAARLMAGGARRLLKRPSTMTITHGQQLSSAAAKARRTTWTAWVLQGVRRRMPRMAMPSLTFPFKLGFRTGTGRQPEPGSPVRTSPQPQPAGTQPLADQLRYAPLERSESWQAALRCLPFTIVKKPELSFMQVFHSMHFIQRDGKQRSCSRLGFRTPNLQLHLERSASASATTALQCCASFVNLNVCTYSNAALIRMFIGSAALMKAKLDRIQTHRRQVATRAAAQGPAPAPPTASSNSQAPAAARGKTAGVGGGTAQPRHSKDSTAFSIDVQIMAVSVRVLVEEAPGVKRPGATQVLAATLANTQLTFAPNQIKQGKAQGYAGAGPGHNAAGAQNNGEMALRCSVGDVRVKDLQGCVEHRGVLTANKAPARPAPTTPPSSPTRRTATGTTPASSSSPAPASSTLPAAGTLTPRRASQASNKANCTLRVLVVLPPSHLSHTTPLTVAVTLDNAKVVFLRRFLANTLYAIDKLLQGLKPLKGHYGYLGDEGDSNLEVITGTADAVHTPRPPAAAGLESEGRGSNTTRPEGSASAAGPAPAKPAAAAKPSGPSPVVLIRLRNTKVLMPASSAAKRGPIKHAVHSDGLGVAIKEVQLCLPLGQLSSYPAQVAALQSQAVQEFLSGGSSALKGRKQAAGAETSVASGSSASDDSGCRWLLDPEATAKMLLSGHELYNSHASSQHGGAQGVGEQRRRQKDGGDASGSATGDGAAGAPETSMPAASGAGGRWQAVKDATRRLVVRPLQDIVAEAKKMSIASNNSEQGTVFLDVDLNEDLDKLPPYLASVHATEQVARFTQDDPVPVKAATVPRPAAAPCAQVAGDTQRQAGEWDGRQQAGTRREEADAGGNARLGAGATKLKPSASGSGVEGDNLWTSADAAPTRVGPGAWRKEAEARELQPVLLLAVRSLEAFSCRIPSQAYSSSGHEMQHSSLEHRAFLDALGRWTEQDPLGIMLPSDLDGVIMKQGLLGALHIHLGVGDWDADSADGTQKNEEALAKEAAEALIASASVGRGGTASADSGVSHQGRMDVVLDPKRYGRLMPVCQGNMVEGASVFELVESEKSAAAARDKRVWNTVMAQVLAFGPLPSDLPSFVMTAGWSHLRATFMNRRTWWDPRKGSLAGVGEGDKASAGEDEAVPFLEVDLKGMSFSLQIIKGSHNLHIATRCREAKVCDVRIQHKAKTSTPAAATAQAGTQAGDGTPVKALAREDSRTSRLASPNLAPAGHSVPTQSPSKLHAADDAAAPSGRRQTPQHRPSRSWTALPTVGEGLAPSEPELRGWARAAAAIKSAQGSKLLVGEHVQPPGTEEQQQQLQGAADESRQPKVVESTPNGAKVVILQSLPAALNPLHPQQAGATAAGGSSPAKHAGGMAGGAPSTGTGAQNSADAAPSSHDNLQVTFHMRGDGTMANEVHLCNVLLQWPYLTDMSLASAMVSIFQPTWCTTVPTTIESLPSKIFHDNGGWPWFYFNLLVTNSEVFVPVMATKLRECAASTAAAVEAASAYEAAQSVLPQDASRSALQAGQQQQQQQQQPVWGRTLSSRHHRNASSASASQLNAVQGSTDDLHGEYRRSPSGGDTLTTRSSNASTRRLGSDRKPSPMAPDHQLLSWPALAEVFQAAVAKGINTPSGDGSAQQPGLKESGIALSLGAMRFGYFMGGDGQSQMLVDLRNTAGFARHRAAVVTNFLLPITKMSVNLSSECPRVAEGYTLRQTVLLARRTLFVYCTQHPAYLAKRRNRRNAITSAPSVTLPARPGLGHVAAAAMMTFQEEMQQRSQRAAGRRRFMPAHMALLSDAWEVAEGLLAESRQQPPAGGLTGDQHLEQQASVHLLPKGWKMPAPAHTTIRVDAEVLRVRLAFSHIPLLHAVLDDAKMAGAYMSKGAGMFPKPVHLLLEEAAAESAARLAGTPTESQRDLAKLRVAFRPTCTELEAQLREASVVLCNDKPNSFGAPDVLQANIESLTAQRLAIQRFARGATEQSVSVDTSVSVNFLNDALGRWERAVDKWRLQLAASQTIDPVFKDNVTTSVQVRSDESLNIVFDPSLLLALGDLIAYKNAVMPPASASTSEAAASEAEAADGKEAGVETAAAVSAQSKHAGLGGEAGVNVASAPVHAKEVRHNGMAADGAVARATASAPPLEEQMALTAPVTSRVPRRYVIHNMTGCSLYYWSGPPELAESRLTSKVHLPHNRSEELQVEPRQEKCRIVGRGDVAQSSYDSAAINLKFEGNWSPILKVALDVVGKYRYHLSTPRRDYMIPLIVDVALVGRTKVIRLHSSLYIQNTTNLNLTFSLHLPSPYLTYSISPTPGDKLISDYEMLLRPMAPGHGFYLPLMACMDGVLALKPDGYQLSQHDVIRLSRDLDTMWDQQGYMLCHAKDKSSGLRPISFCVKVNGGDTDYMRHNYDAPSPGEFTQAAGAMEAFIQVTPTVELTNSLPYLMKGYIITIKKPEDQPKEQQQRTQQQQQQPQQSASMGMSDVLTPGLGSPGGGAAAAAGVTPVTPPPATATADTDAAPGISAFAPLSRAPQPASGPGPHPPRHWQGTHGRLASVPSVPASLDTSRASSVVSDHNLAPALEALRQAGAAGTRAGAVSEIVPVASPASGAGIARPRRALGLSVLGSGKLGSGKLVRGKQQRNDDAEGPGEPGIYHQSSVLERAGSMTSAISNVASGVASSVKSRVGQAGATVAQAGVAVAGVVTAAGSKAVGEIASRIGRQPERLPTGMPKEDDISYERAVSSFIKLAELLGKKPGDDALYSVSRGVRFKLKHQMLRAVRSSLKWVVKSSVWREMGFKELEPMFPKQARDAEHEERMDNHLHWSKLHELFEWLLHSLLPFQLAPGQSKSFYVDLTNTVMLAVKVPELSLKTDRPSILNVSDPLLLLTDSSHDGNMAARQRGMLRELPREMRLHKQGREVQRMSPTQADMMRQGMSSLATAGSLASTMVAQSSMPLGADALRSFNRISVDFPDTQASAWEPQPQSTASNVVPESSVRVGSNMVAMADVAAFAPELTTSPWDLASFAKRLETLPSSAAAGSTKKQKPKTYRPIWGRAIAKEKLRSSLKEREKERESPPRVRTSGDKGADSPLVRVTLVAHPSPAQQEGSSQAPPRPQISVNLTYPSPVSPGRPSADSLASQAEVLERRPTRLMDFWRRASTSIGVGAGSSGGAGTRHGSGGGGDGSVGGNRTGAGSVGGSAGVGQGQASLSFQPPSGPSGAPTVGIEMSGWEPEAPGSGSLFARTSEGAWDSGPTYPGARLASSKLGTLLTHMRRQAHGQEGLGQAHGSGQGPASLSSSHNARPYSELHLEAIREAVSGELEGLAPQRTGASMEGRAVPDAGTPGSAGAAAGARKAGKLAAAWRVALGGSSGSSSASAAAQASSAPATVADGAGNSATAPGQAPVAALPATSAGAPVVWDNNPAFSRSPTPTPPSSIGQVEAGAGAGAGAAGGQAALHQAPGGQPTTTLGVSAAALASAAAAAKKAAADAAPGSSASTAPDSLQNVLSPPTFGSTLRLAEGTRLARPAPAPVSDPPPPASLTPTSQGEEATSSTMDITGDSGYLDTAPRRRAPEPPTSATQRDSSESLLLQPSSTEVQTPDAVQGHGNAILSPWLQAGVRVPVGTGPEAERATPPGPKVPAGRQAGPPSAKPLLAAAASAPDMRGRLAADEQPNDESSRQRMSLPAFGPGAALSSAQGSGRLLRSPRVSASGGKLEEPAESVPSTSGTVLEPGTSATQGRGLGGGSMPNAFSQFLSSGVTGGSFMAGSMAMRRGKEVLLQSTVRAAHTAAEVAGQVVETTVDATHALKEGTEQMVAEGRKAAEEVTVETKRRVKIGVWIMQWGITKAISKAAGRRRTATAGRALDGEGAAVEHSALTRALKQRQRDQERSFPADNRLCPPEVLLSINNSMATDGDFSCQVKVSAAFWVDNRTGLDLMLKDMDVPATLADMPCLFYQEVLAPAVKVDRPPPKLGNADDSGDEGIGNSAAQVGQEGVQGVEGVETVAAEGIAEDYAALAEATHRLALMNEQSLMSFRLQDRTYGDTKYCASFKAHNAGQKSIVLKGPSKRLEPQAPRIEPVTTQVSSDFTSVPGSHGSFGLPAAIDGPSHCQRLFCFSVEVWNPPPGSVFQHTKIVTIKNRYIIRNETGFTIEYKQFGTPDPGACEYGYGQRFAGDLDSNCSVGFHWDNDEGGGVKKELVIRPTGQWHWSGSFPLTVKEQYFGLKIRRMDHTEIKIIPVNITVGASGSVLITLKSDSSMSNYMVLNMCRDIVINLRQKAPDEDDVESHNKWVGWDVFDPDPLKRPKLVPFAWDEPNEDHVLEIVPANADKEYMSALVRQQHAEQKERERKQREAARAAGASGDGPVPGGVKHPGAAADPSAAAGSEGASAVARSSWVDYDDLKTYHCLTLDIRELRNRARDTDKPYKELQVTTRDMRKQPLPGETQSHSGSATFAEAPQSMGPGQSRMGSVVQRAGPGVIARDNSIVGSMRWPTGQQAGMQRSGTALHRGTGYERAERERAVQPMYTKKVYVKLYYDGPTEVLCFSEDPPSTHSENHMAESLLQQLLIKLQMLYKQLAAADRLLAKLGVAKDDIEMKHEELQAQPSQPSTPRLRFMDSKGRRRSVVHHEAEHGLASYGSGTPHLPGHQNKVYARLGKLLKEVQYGGDVKVQVRQARGLLSVGKGMQLVAQVAVGEELKAIDELASLTGIGQFEWNKEVLLRDVYSAGQLRLLVWAVPDGTQHDSTHKKNVRAKDNEEPVKDDSDDYGGMSSLWKSKPISALQPPMLGATLVGVAEVSLVDTIQAQQKRQRDKQQHEQQQKRRQGATASAGAASTSAGGAAEDADKEAEQSAQWYPLRRWEGNKAVKGEIELSLEWTFTKTGKLQQQIKLLDMVLSEKMELVAALTPVMPWVAKESVIDPDATTEPPQPMAKYPSGAAGPSGAAAAPTAAPPRPKKLPTHWETAEALEKARDVGRDNAAAAAEVEGQVLGRGPTIQRSVAQVELRQDRYQVNLEASVLEIRNLAPREGLAAKFINHLKGVQVSSGVTKMLPRARVELRVGHQRAMQAVSSPSLNPILPKNSNSFTDVELKQNLEVKVYDRMLSLCGKEQLRSVGSAMLPLSCIPSTDPIYIWVPLKRTKSEQAAAQRARDTSASTGDLAVFLRLQLAKPQARGVSVGIDADLHGLGLMAKSSVNELFHFTLKRVSGTWMLTPVEGLVYLSVQTLQLDNQLIDTQRPVVLSPNIKSSAQNSKQLPMRNFGSGDADKAPIISLVIQRRFAGTPRSKATQGATGAPHNQNEIVSIKKFHLKIQPLDFVTDQEFFEEVYMFLHTLPLANLRQDKHWQAEMAASQGMPRISSTRELPTVGSAPLRAGPKRTITPTSPNGAPALEDGASGDGSGGTPRHTGASGDAYRSSMPAALRWLVDKERNELQVMRGQSSTWFMLHDFHVSALNINITLALNSNLGQGMGAKGGPGGPGGQAAPSRAGRANVASSKGVMRGMLSRISGEDGFQLVNVTNATIQLQAFQLKESESWLVNRVAFWHLFVRHYTSTGLTEARKILGGAGPAIATLLASVIWASIFYVDLSQEVLRRRKSPSSLITGFFFCTLTSFGQILGVLPRMLASFMAFLPVQREGWLSDGETLQRMTARPQTLVDALYFSNRDLLHAVTLALAGLLLDPYEGARLPGYWAIPGVAAGLIKAAIGLGLRPTIGFVEFCSKNIQGVGLAFQGKQGIQGKLIRRVSAPGAPMQNVVSWNAEQEAEARRANINAAWQQQLHWLEPAMASDKVLDVLQCRYTRVALLTDRHLAYLYAREQHASDTQAGDAEAYTFKVKWFLPIHQIDNIRAVDKSLRITIDYRKPLSLGKFLSMRLQLHKGMRCSTEEAHRNLIMRLNLHIRRSLCAEQDQRARGDGVRLPQDGSDLSIVSPT